MRAEDCSEETKRP